MKHFILLFLFFICSCGNKNYDKKTFLEFKLGAPRDVYFKTRDSLIRANALDYIYIGDAQESIYNFGLPQNSKISGLITPKFSDQRLYSIWIELGSANGSKFYQNIPKNKIEQLLNIFDDKYGSHKIGNRSVPKYGTLFGVNVECNIWDNGFYEIIFFPGYLHLSSEDRYSEYDSSVIKYEVKDSETEKWKKDALKNKTNEF